MTTPRSSRRAELGLLLRHLRRSLALAASVDRAHVAAYVALGLVESALPIAIAWVGKQIVDAVVAAGSRSTPDWHDAVMWVSIEAALVIARIAIGQATGYAGEALRARMAVEVQGIVADKASRLSMRHFEDPQFMDVLERAKKDATWRPIEMITHVVALLRQIVMLGGFAILLAAFSPWAVLALALASLPFFAESYFSAKEYDIRTKRTLEERRSYYYQQALTSDSLVKEVKLFGLAGFFWKRWRAIQERFLAEDRAFMRRRALWVTTAFASSSVAFYGALVWIVVLAVRGDVTLGAMVLYLGVLRQSQGAFQTAISAISSASIDSLYMSNLFAYLDIPDDDHAKVDPYSATSVPLVSSEVVFEDVSFSYPGSTRLVLDGVDLRIAPGEAVALVGVNGAGKTTLIKLLTGLHRPSAGRVLLGADDTAALDPGELRARIGVVFQDFAHYHLTAAENVGIGWVPAHEDRAAIEEAARLGGAASVIEGLPSGYDTMLGRWFGGEQLSIGQWQRVALARAFMRKSGVLVLDEPTASLDAEAEHAIFERFKELAAGRTVLLVTHRFSTVRMADRIVVLEEGRVTETGSHAELLAAGGTYARMFTLQAEGYRREA